MPGHRNNATAENKQSFLIDYAQHGVVYQAARAAGVDRVTVWRWREADPAFAAAMDSARESSTDRLEQSLFDRALASDTVAAIFLLKGRRREIYGDRLDVTHTLRAEAERVAATLGLSVEDVLAEADRILTG